ncbi:hypothetical protein ORJ04_21585 [Rheinheimera baltica]|uniref:Uncharacterized protein n=1 Tax=Rheinheimera baltica TaxID=67576 RepID=A0ABT9I634_9GAMM|nr:hypothetical protein [Rheinheimera baltica]MDP5138543.1 hypothetical protein [Rheinheimera baltica]MDP5144043.1 hypothetical protein [Rheinheimera baltica]MDP5148853.1 hypothetical protein [Rheinheimera baltica]
MKKTTRLQKYVELFRRNIEGYLASNVCIKTTIYPVDSEGAVFEFIFNTNNDKTEKIESLSPTVGSVLSKVPQRMVAGNLEGVSFGGTNIYMEGNRLLLIKGEDEPKQWSGTAVQNDVLRVVSTSQGGARNAS